MSTVDVSQRIEIFYEDLSFVCEGESKNYVVNMESKNYVVNMKSKNYVANMLPAMSTLWNCSLFQCQCKRTGSELRYA
jgi:hypothetical protein